MIPATAWADQGNGTAWLSVQRNSPNPLDDAIWWTVKADRPCDTCGGKSHVWAGTPSEPRAMDCHCINGRHTFPLDVECGCTFVNADPAFPECVITGTRSLRVSVVPDMILPITDHFVQGPHVRLRNGRAVYVEANERQHPITLPSGAKPGGFAVLVNWRTA